MMDFIMRQITPTTTPLPLFKPMAQSWRGATQILEAQVRLLITVILRFIQPHMPLLPLDIIKSIIIGTRKIHLSKAVWFNVIFACNGID
jgi:hypothetical protein